MMSNLTNEPPSMGWRLDNSYARLPDILLTRLMPTPVKEPKLIMLNDQLVKSLGLNFANVKKNHVASIFSGNSIPVGADCIAQAYAGHQFGYFAVLGDGRALLLGEQVSTKGTRFDIQLKGSGGTPYSRGGDGRAALGPVLREYVISESMFALGIPTTRSLAAVSTGESVFRETALPGAILTRVASSHLRIGTFQYAAMGGDLKVLKSLVNYAIKRHCPEVVIKDIPALGLLKFVLEKQLKLVVDWMRVGFIHGVMNTDNTSISGETIDYGPCAFMNSYAPETVFSSIDVGGRYSFGNQPSIIHWNLLRLAEALLPIIDKDKDRAVKIAEKVVMVIPEVFDHLWLKMMKKKLGLFGQNDGDRKLIYRLLAWMAAKKADYTNTFLSLFDKQFSNEKLLQDSSFIDWKKDWEARIAKNNKPKKDSIILMQKNNPVLIPRNHIVEEALAAANDGSLDLINKLVGVLSCPYKEKKGLLKYQVAPSGGDDNYKTFCGT